MDKQTRDYYIDNVRGLATVSVIFIHTVFWSGAFYVPDFMRNISLFFDVPVFFLLTGFVFKATGKKDAIQQSLKIVMYFTLFVIAMNAITLNLNTDQIIQAITMTSATIPAFPVVGGSYWFVPMYVASVIISQALLQYSEKMSVILIPLALLYYLFSYITHSTIDYQMLGVSANSLLFYVTLIIAGYHLYNFKGKKVWLLIATVFILVFFILYKTNPDAVNLQKFKLNLSLPYVLASLISVCVIFSGIFTSKKTPLSWIGQRAIFFYMAQGIGASLLYQVVHIIKMPWPAKLLMMFALNLSLTLIIGVIFYYLVNKSALLLTRRA
ncbi:acyltransferase family protein [Erwinia sorbitola]|uniref:acyltransferase family protein n=1 Tax=Erwinia sorbitola TaxID=2681984 RepID=UPI00403FB059